MEAKYFPNNEFDIIPCGIVAFACETPWKIIYANEKYYSYYADNNIDTLNVLKEDEEKLAQISGILEKQETAEISYRCNIGGKQCYVSMLSCKYKDGICIGTLRDVTEKSKMMQEMEKENEKFTLALCNSKNIIFEDDVIENKSVLYVPKDNDTIETVITENTYEELANNIVHAKQKDFIMKNIYNPEERTLSAKMKMPFDTEWKWYRMYRQFDFDEDGKLLRIFGVICDIDDEKEKEKEMLEKIEIDPVLGIYNRNAAVGRINKYLTDNEDSRDYALFVMDIDDFKSINDNYGHLYGDAIIEMTAVAIKEEVEDCGFAGRYGGDEFFAFVYGLDEAGIARIADGILDKMKTFHNADDRVVTGSIGIATGALFESQPVYKDLFEKADKALYKVKNDGKAHWRIYNDDMSESSGRAIDYETSDEGNDKELLESKDLVKVFLELSSGAKTSDGAVYNIMRYITERFNFDWMQIMQVNTTEDLITIKYEWCNQEGFRNNSGKSGYYVHSDVMLFRNHFENNPVFRVTPEATVGFSMKFMREFEKNMKYNVIYVSHTTADENFYMFICTRFDKSHVWADEECQEISNATKMMAMYIAQAGKESTNELKLKRMVDYDRKTDLYSVAEFYVQLGRIRKMAKENDEDIIVFHIDIGNFLQFNRDFGIEAGDSILYEFGNHIKLNSDPEKSVSTHLDGTDIFFSAQRVKRGDRSCIDRYFKACEIFCKKKNKQYQGANLIIRVGYYTLKDNEDGGFGFDCGLLAKKALKDRSKTVFVEYTEN